MPQALPANTLGSPFIELQSVDSTNNYARDLIRAALSEDPPQSLHGQIVFAHEQFAGKGQRGKTWLSEKRYNLSMSLILDPQHLNISDQFQLNACIALSVCEFFMNYAGDKTRIKWPNDIYWQDRKAGGILIESGIGNTEDGKNKWQWVIAGIGININQTNFPADLANPVSLKQITGKTFEPIRLAKEICAIIEKNYQLLLNKEFMTILSRYNELLYKKDQLVKLKKDNRIFEAVIKTVNSSGQLVVHHACEEVFDFGEVEWLFARK